MRRMRRMSSASPPGMRITSEGNDELLDEKLFDRMSVW